MGESNRYENPPHIKKESKSNNSEKETNIRGNQTNILVNQSNIGQNQKDQSNMEWTYPPWL